MSVECGADLEIAGEENVTLFNSSKWAERGFCSTCGTHLFYRLKGANHYSIPVGLLDNASRFELKTQLFIDSKPSCYSFSNSTRDLTGAEAFALYESGQKRSE